MLGSETKKELEILIEKYGEEKEKLNYLKKKTEDINTRIKALLVKNDLDSFESDNYYVKYQTKKSESLDENAVIEILKNNGIRNIVKTKQYIDENALEDAIYNGKLNSDIIKEINQCRTTTYSYALIVKEKK